MWIWFAFCCRATTEGNKKPDSDAEKEVLAFIGICYKLLIF